MKAHAWQNHYMIDLYIKHDEIELGASENDNIFWSNEGDGSNNVGDESDEVDDYNWAESVYSMNDEDDMLFNRDVDKET